MKHVMLLALLLLIATIGMAQNQNNIWCFGDHAGLDFNTPTPTALTGVQMLTQEGCTSIADTNGNLLFYSDGKTVWNKLHAVMPNGTGLLGHSSTTQAALIVPIPNSTTQYYVFTIGELGGAMYYSVVDMSLGGGNGDVVTTSKNTMLHPTVSEKQCAVKRCDGNVWLLSHEWNSNVFFADLILLQV